MKVNVDKLKDSLKKLKKAVDDDNLKGLSVVDEDDMFGEDDEAAKWLQEHEKQVDSPNPTRSYNRPWKAPQIDDKELAQKINNHMDKGYSEEEAHWHHGAHKYPTNLENAMRSGIYPQMPSDKFFEDHKDLVGNWLENARRVEMRGAQEDKNPVKYAAGQMRDAYDQHSAPFDEAYNKFLKENSHLSGRQLHTAIQDWEDKWHNNNPDYHDGLVNIASKQSGFVTAKQSAKQSLQDKIDVITMGGAGTAADETFSTKEGAQHLGFDSKDLGEGSSFAPRKDRLAAMSSNKKLMNVLNEERQERLKRVDSAAKAQGVIRKPKVNSDAD